MGCDYYTYVLTRIQFTNAGGHLQTYEEKGDSERHYYHFCDEVDSDIDEPINWAQKKEEALDQECERYGQRVLFADGEWRCQPAGKDRILALCAERKIPVESLVRVYKVKSGHLR